MDPFGALRRRVGQGREAGLEKSRQDALLRAPELRQLARTCGLSPGSLASRVIGPQVTGLREVGVRASGQDRCRDLFRDLRLTKRSGVLVVSLQQKPLLSSSPVAVGACAPDASVLSDARPAE